MDEMAEPGAPLYRAVWRWHFYAALFVIPFLFLLALSGSLMLLSQPLESLLNQRLLVVSPDGEPLPPAALLSAVENRYPDALTKIYIPGQSPSESTRFVLTPAGVSGHGGHDTASTTVFVNPYTGQILGSQDPAASLYSWFKSLHGSLFLGDLGDGLIEVAAGLAILMIVTGLYLAWPRNGWRDMLPLRSLLSRQDWRRLHALVGWLIALPLLMFLLSGLAWTNVWGGKLVQAWGSLPGTRFETQEVEHSHQTMNEEGVHQVPWTLEQTALPEPVGQTNGLDLNAVVEIAAAQGFDHYRVHLPRGDHRVWTLSATTIAGDIDNPLGERTLHLNPEDGRILADLRFADYPAVGKAMASFVPLHQGDLGLWNWLLNLLFMALVMLLLVSGLALWWKRRPKRHVSLAPPAASPRAGRGVGAVLFILALCFPLSAAAIALVVILDTVGLLIIRRRRVFG